MGDDIREWTFKIPKQSPNNPATKQSAVQDELGEDAAADENKLQTAFKRLQFNRRSSDSEGTLKKAYIVVPGELIRRYAGFASMTLTYI